MPKDRNYIPKKGILFGSILIHPQAKKFKREDKDWLYLGYEFNCTTMFAIICPITSTIKNLPTRYSLPKDLDTKGQVLISQLKSLDFKERKLKKVENLPLQDMAKIDQIIQYIF